MIAYLSLPGSPAEQMDTRQNMDHDDSFSILAQDGGGARGIYAAQMLARIEVALDARIKDCFNLIAGTSTGFILGGAAATAIPMADIPTGSESAVSEAA